MSNIDAAKAAAAIVFKPPPRLTVSQWADEFRRLSPEASAAPGRWRTDAAPYQRGILDALNDPEIETIVVMSSAQVGKTEILLNLIGYFVHQDPSPILCLQPTLDMAEAFSKDRLAPMVRDTPALSGKIADPRSRDSGNTLLHKKFPGGHITMAGANSPASLASRPIRVVLCDEVDRYPASAAAEGDPVNLARKRSTTFWNRKVVLTSTPTLKGFSRIENAFEGSDRRRYHVPCCHCGTRQELTWANVKWPDDEPGKAQIACADCGTLWSESDRQQAIRDGEWVAEAPGGNIAGFHLSELYSPWSTPARMAKAFLEAKHGGTEQLKTWVNTSLGQSWEDEGETIDGHALMDRRELFREVLPEKVGLLTIGADIQSDRIEYELVGWAEDQESWSIDYEILPGDPTQDAVWQDFAAVINTRYPHSSGVLLNVARVCVDAGYLTARVQEFCRKLGAHVVPVIGRAGPGKPVVPTYQQRLQRMRKPHKRRGVSEVIGVDEAKAHTYRRLLLNPGEPKSCHFPMDRDEEYFMQLTAEKLVIKYSKGRPVIEWQKIRQRNEALDCRVYAYAAMLLYGADKITQPAPDKPPAARPKPIQARQNSPRFIIR